MDRETQRAEFIQQLDARTIEREGPQVFLGSPTGRAVRMIPASLEARDSTFVVQPDQNAADVDWTAFVASPLSFPPAAGAKPESAWPQGGNVLFWHSEAYTVTGVRKVDKGDVTVALRLIAYRTPGAADSRASESATADQLAVWKARLP